MLKTIIDFGIFEDFTSNQPKPVPIGTEEDIKTWNTFWEFLKSGSDVTITNYKNQENIFLNNLTTGRKGTKCKIEEKFNRPNKFIFPKNQDIKSVFLIDEPTGQGKISYRRKNGYVFGFKEDYTEVWKDLSLLEKPKILPVRKNAKIKLSSWNQLSDYILPFTDMIIVDNYMFDETVWDFNLLRIIEEFAKKTPVKFNLLLLSYFNENTLTKSYVSTLHKKIEAKLIEREIKCNLSIALANYNIKEHDRGIFTNYLRVKSGDSFVYFDKNGKMITKGTEIDFQPLVEVDKINASDAALADIHKLIDKLNSPLLKEKRLAGDLKNRLIE